MMLRAHVKLVFQKPRKYLPVKKNVSQSMRVTFSGGQKKGISCGMCQLPSYLNNH